MGPISGSRPEALGWVATECIETISSEESCREFAIAVLNALDRKLGESKLASAQYVKSVAILSKKWSLLGEFAKAEAVYGRPTPQVSPSAGPATFTRDRSGDAAGMEKFEAMAELARLQWKAGVESPTPLRKVKGKNRLTIEARIVGEMANGGRIAEGYQRVANALRQLARRDGARAWGPGEMQLSLAVRYAMTPGHIDDATRLFELALQRLKTKPHQDIYGLTALAAALHRGGKQEQARELFEQAAHAAQNDRFAHTMLPVVAKAQSLNGSEKASLATFGLARKLLDRIRENGQTLIALHAARELIEASGECGLAELCHDAMKCGREIASGFDKDKQGGPLCDFAVHCARAASGNPSLIGTPDQETGAEAIMAYVRRRLRLESASRLPEPLIRAQAILQAARGKVDLANRLLSSMCKPEHRNKAIGDVAVTFVRRGEYGAALDIAQQLNDGKRLKKIVQALFAKRRFEEMLRLAPAASRFGDSGAVVVCGMIELFPTLSDDELAEIEAMVRC